MATPKTDEAKARAEWTAAQAKANADQATRRLRDAERDHLTTLWGIRFDVRDAVAYVASDDEAAADARRAETLAGLKVSWCQTLSELRGCRYRLGDEAMKESDPGLPAHLVNVSVPDEDAEFVRDLLRARRPRQGTRMGQPTAGQRTADIEALEARVSALAA